MNKMYQTQSSPSAKVGPTNAVTAKTSITADVSDISVIRFDGVKVRIVNMDGDPWFIAKDVCEALEIVDHKVALRRLDADEKGECLTPTPGGLQIMRTVCESGFYKLIARSRKATTEGTFAHRFTNWVFREVKAAT